MNENDLFLYGLIALSAAMLFFMYRSNKKRQTQAREMQDKLVEGAEVMTNFGLFGKDAIEVAADIDVGNITAVDARN